MSIGGNSSVNGFAAAQALNAAKPAKKEQTAPADKKREEKPTPQPQSAGEGAKKAEDTGKKVMDALDAQGNQNKAFIQNLSGNENTKPAEKKDDKPAQGSGDEGQARPVGDPIEYEYEPIPMVRGVDIGPDGEVVAIHPGPGADPGHARPVGGFPDPQLGPAGSTTPFVGSQLGPEAEQGTAKERERSEQTAEALIQWEEGWVNANENEGHTASTGYQSPVPHAPQDIIFEPWPNSYESDAIEIVQDDYATKHENGNYDDTYTATEIMDIANGLPEGSPEREVLLSMTDANGDGKISDDEAENVRLLSNLDGTPSEKLSARELTEIQVRLSEGDNLAVLIDEGQAMEDE